MRPLYFFISIFAFLSLGGNSADAHILMLPKPDMEIQKLDYNLQQFTAPDQDSTLFNDTDTDTAEDYTDTDSIKDGNDNMPAVLKSALCNPWPRLLIPKKAIAYFYSVITPQSFTGYSSPIYITLRVLRI